MNDLIMKELNSNESVGPKQYIQFFIERLALTEKNLKKLETKEE